MYCIFKLLQKKNTNLPGHTYSQHILFQMGVVNFRYECKAETYYLHFFLCIVLVPYLPEVLSFTSVDCCHMAAAKKYARKKSKRFLKSKFPKYNYN